MDKKYIEFDKLIECLWSDFPAKIMDVVENMDAADVVPRSAYEQVLWERDVAIAQLKEHGIPFGEKRRNKIGGLYMQEMVFTCDHCGKKLDGMKDYTDTEFDTINEWFKADLCTECYKEISCIIKQFCNRKGQDEK